MWMVMGLALAVSNEPAEAVWHTAGVSRFIEALEAADQGTPLRRALRRHYLKPGTGAQRWFLRYGRAANAGTLARCVKRYGPLYAQLPDRLRDAQQTTPAILEHFAALEEAYPAAVFPDIHVHVGCFDSAGTATDHGLHIGFEHFTRPDPFPERLEETRWSWALHPIGRFPVMVVHELAHYQQQQGADSLLHHALVEGGADFVAQTLTGGVVTPNHSWGLAHEEEVWRAFSAQKGGPSNVGRWFYTDTGTDWPRDLGYFVGFRIAEEYYRQADDKTAALAALLRLDDVEAILRESGYDGRSSKPSPAPFSAAP